MSIKIDLDTGRRDRRDLDNQLMVVVVDDEVHTREPDHLMQLMAPFVDAAVSGHERADFVAALLHRLRKFPAQKRTFRIRGRMERPPDIRIVSCSMPLLNVFLRFLCGPVQTSSVAVLADRNRCFFMFVR